MINTIIQIILSVFLISIMAFICYSIYNNEIIKTIKLNSSTKLKTEIFTGIFDFTEQKNIMVETYDRKSKHFLDINPSINQNGGAEYSYNFWLFFDLDSTNGLITNQLNPNISNEDKKNAYIVLFYKGELNKLPLKENDYQCKYTGNRSILEENINIKNPLVKIRNDGKEIIVEYNNINHPETYNTSAKKIDCEKKLDERNLNKFGIKEIDTMKLKQKFNMITIVFQEKPKNETIFNIEYTNCKVYFNGILIENRIANSSAIENNNDYTNIRSRVMKSNLSKLLLNPISITKAISSIDNISINNNNNNLIISPLQLADLSYYNYALSQKEVNSLYNKGFTNNKIISFKSEIKNVFDKGSLPKYNKNDYVQAI
jgi:hypothetical protein